MTAAVLIRQHNDAFLAQLRLDSVLASVTFDGEVTGSPQGYCVVNFNNGDRYGDRLTSPDVSATFRAGVRWVGTDRFQAQAIAERGFAQLMNVRLVVDGRQLSLIRHAGGQQTQLDEATSNPRLWFGTDFFEFDSDPLP